jgi:hypothetical protein
MGVTGAVMGAAYIYGMIQQDRNSRKATRATENERDRQHNLMTRREKQLKNKQANDDALESSKIIRARRQALLFGGATKNNTIRSSPVGVSSPTALGLTGSGAAVGGKTLLGM